MMQGSTFDGSPRPAPLARAWPGARALLLLLAAAGSVTAVPGYSDELKTSSGETLIGTVVDEQADSVTFESQAFGRLTVPRDRILSLTREPAPQPTQPPEQAAATTEKEKAEAQSLERQAELRTDAVGQFLARINPLKGWKTNLNLGFVARRGDDRDNDITIRFRSNRHTEAGDEHTLEARYYYAEDVLLDSQKTATDDLLSASYRYRHPLSEAWFFQSRSGYYRDRIKELDHELTQTFGLGLNAGGEPWRLTLTPVIGVQWKEIAGEDITNPVGGLYQESRFDITRTLVLSQNLDYLIALDNRDDYSSRFALELSQKLGAAWALSLRYEYTYDSIVGKDASEDQQRLSLTLGLEF
jgi:putative salt-induced outer membrane protein YdiY